MPTTHPPTHPPHHQPLPVREDPKVGTVQVAGLSATACANPNEVLDLLSVGNENRKTESTAANAVSSRSHALLWVTVRHSFVNKDGNNVRREGRLSLIDLAGSERASATQNSGTRLQEGAKINRSLLALANCINALTEGARSVNYRDSKLTHLLKSSLEGQCRVIMIANINPNGNFYEDSHNTIKYANRAKVIKVKCETSNEVVGSSHTAANKETNELRSELESKSASNERLREEVKHLKSQIQAASQVPVGTEAHDMVTRGCMQAIKDVAAKAGNLCNDGHRPTRPSDAAANHSALSSSSSSASSSATSSTKRPRAASEASSDAPRAGRGMEELGQGPGRMSMGMAGLDHDMGAAIMQKLDSIGLAMVAQPNGAMGVSSASSAEVVALQSQNQALSQARDDLARRVIVLEAEVQDAAKAAETQAAAAAAAGATLEGSAAERAQVIADAISKARTEAYAEGEAAGTETAMTAAAQLAQETANATAAQTTSLEAQVADLEVRLAEAIELATEAISGRDRADLAIKAREAEIAELTTARDAAERKAKGLASAAGPGTEAPANKPPPPPGPPPGRAPKDAEKEAVAPKERAPKRRHSLIPKPNTNRHSLGGVAPNPTPVESKPERVSTRSKASSTTTTETAAGGTSGSTSRRRKFGGDLTNSGGSTEAASASGNTGAATTTLGAIKRKLQPYTLRATNSRVSMAGGQASAVKDSKEPTRTSKRRRVSSVQVSGLLLQDTPCPVPLSPCPVPRATCPVPPPTPLALPSHARTATPPA